MSGRRVKLNKGMSFQERREVRAQSKAMLEEVQAEKRALVDDQGARFADVISKVDGHFTSKVRYHSDARHDARTVRELTQIAHLKAKNLATPTSHLTFDLLKEYLHASKYKTGRSINWKQLGNDCGVYWRTAPHTSFMRGPLAVEVVKKVRQKRVREKDDPVEVARPDVQKEAKIGAEAKDGAQRSLRLWRHVSKLQERKAQATGSGALPLMNTFMNPDSFSKTVEHLFYYSFLVKEGKATVRLKDGQPVAGLVNEEGVSTIGMSQEDIRATGAAMAEAAGAHQGIVSLDMESFLEARRAYQVSESALPDFEKGAPQDVDIAKQAHDRKRYPLKPHMFKKAELDALRGSSGAGGGAANGAGQNGHGLDDNIDLLSDPGSGDDTEDDELPGGADDAWQAAAKGKGKGKGKGESGRAHKRRRT